MILTGYRKENSNVYSFISKASRGWWEPGGVNQLKFPFELQAEGFIVGCAGNPPLLGSTYDLYVLKLVFYQFEWYTVEDNSSSHSRRRVFYL